MDEENLLPFGERRKHSRRKHITGITYSVLVSLDGVGVIKNVSEGGLCLILDRYLSPGTIIKVRFALPQDDQEIPIKAIAKVVWCKQTDAGYLTGIQFIS